MALREESPGVVFGAARAETARYEASAYWICLALLLAVAVLGARIASVL